MLFMPSMNRVLALGQDVFDLEDIEVHSVSSRCASRTCSYVSNLEAHSTIPEVMAKLIPTCKVNVRPCTFLMGDRKEVPLQVEQTQTRGTKVLKKKLN